MSPHVVRAMLELAPTETDVAVRAQLACTARRLPSSAAIQLAQRLAARNEDQADPFVPLLLWWAIEQHADVERAAVIEWLCDSTTPNQQIVRQTILPRFLRRLAAVGDAPSLKGVAQILNASRVRASQVPLLDSIEQGWHERRANDPTPDELTESVRLLWREDTREEALLRLATRLDISNARQRVSELILDHQASEAERKMGIGILADLGSEADARMLTTLVLDQREIAEIRLAAIDAVQRFALIEVCDSLLAVYPDSKAPLKERLQSALLSRPEWATRFLAEFDLMRLPITDLTAEQWQGIANRLDPEARGRISRLWGRVSPPTPEERLAEVRRLNNDLRAETGSAEKGHPLFTQHCAICHRLHGEGQPVGPDLTHANRSDRDYLLVQLIDPNAIIRKEYVTYNAVTKDGRVLTGLLVEQNAGGVTLLAAKAEKVTIAASNLDELRESEVSLMPENVLKKLTPQELRDLFAFLQSAAPEKK
ncbi:MAG: c-type cytochrome [Planctomycetaceae bacterium]|nr:c-type cytochrome [Planctomycetaceae bacterium]